MWIHRIETIILNVRFWLHQLCMQKHSKNDEKIECNSLVTKIQVINTDSILQMLNSESWTTDFYLFTYSSLPIKQSLDVTTAPSSSTLAWWCRVAGWECDVAACRAGLTPRAAVTRGASFALALALRTSPGNNTRYPVIIIIIWLIDSPQVDRARYEKRNIQCKTYMNISILMCRLRSTS